MLEPMARVHITEDELARDTHAVLSKVQEGIEVIVEQHHRPVAVIKTPQGPGRKISECIALAKAYEKRLGYSPVPDPEFARDVQAGEPFTKEMAQVAAKLDASEAIGARHPIPGFAHRCYGLSLRLRGWDSEPSPLPNDPGLQVRKL